MKLTNHIQLESSIIATTLFVTGVILSIGALFEYQRDSSVITIPQICMTVGLTFFLGLIAIHFTARSIKQTVVYLERQRKETEQVDEKVDTENQLDVAPVERALTQNENRNTLLINELSRQLEAGQAALYVREGESLVIKAGYAITNDQMTKYSCTIGEGLVGRVAATAQSLYVDNLPERYITIYSGLGSASPRFLVIVPLVDENEAKGVLELALFKPVTRGTMQQLEEIGKMWARVGL
jgi:methyl-accepting chemotaxis protein